MMMVTAVKLTSEPQLLSPQTFLLTTPCCRTHCSGFVLNYRCTNWWLMFRIIYQKEIFMRLDAQSLRYMGIIFTNIQWFTSLQQLYTLYVPFNHIKPFTALSSATIQGFLHSCPKEISSDRLWNLVQQCMAYKLEHHPDAARVNVLLADFQRRQMYLLWWDNAYIVSLC